MIQSKFRTLLERGAKPDLWRNTLTQIPSVFGRLVYLTSLRDPNSGRYEHAGLALIFGERDADAALRDSHCQTFSEWLKFDLEQQKADLDLYLAGLLETRRTIVESWSRLSPYRSLMPATVEAHAANLYLADFSALLRLMMNEYGVAAGE